ncbi:MAG: hypothetical protein M1826_002752 [Phylliscum demangeonii]|nr:MAG: hypothetical protein M1826_002752 [Phylliscum demangeonii]
MYVHVVDTAPSPGKSLVIKDVTEQKSLRSTDQGRECMADFKDLADRLRTGSGIEYSIHTQAEIPPGDDLLSYRDWRASGRDVADLYRIAQEWVRDTKRLFRDHTWYQLHARLESMAATKRGSGTARSALLGG